MESSSALNPKRDFNTDKLLNKLFYDNKLGIAGKANFIKKVRALHQDIKVKDINEWLNNQTVNQVNATEQQQHQPKKKLPPRRQAVHSGVGHKTSSAGRQPS